MSSHSNGNNREVELCCQRSRDCVAYILFLSSSSFIFITGMIVTAYLTHVDNMQVALVVLIASTCLLYLLCFASNIYTFYYRKPNRMPSENGGSSNRLSHTTSSSNQSTVRYVRPLDVVNLPRSRELFIRGTPPPPYEIQMTAMPVMPRPGTSRTTKSSARETEIAEEARKVIQKIYEDMKMAGHTQLAPQSSTNEQQMSQMPKSPVSSKKTELPIISHQNLVVQKQQKVQKVGTNQVIQQNATRSSIPALLDSERLVIGSEGCSAVPPKSSPRIPGRPPSMNQVVRQEVVPNLHPNQRDLKKFVIDSEECGAVPPIPSPRINDRPSPGMNRVVRMEVVPNLNPTQRDLKKLVIDSEECDAVLPIPSPRIPGRPPSTNRVVRQEVAPNSHPTQCDLKKFVTDSEVCVTSPLQQSPRISGRPPSTNQAVGQEMVPNLHSAQHDLKKFVIDSEGSAASLQQSPRREDFFKMTHKTKLSSPSQKPQTMLKTKGDITHMIAVDKSSQNNVYEEIEVLEDIQNANSSQEANDSVEYYCTGSEFGDSSDQETSVTSAASEAGPPELKRGFVSQNVKERQLSALSTKKFCQLGQSSVPVLEAISEGFEMTPVEWMDAWKLSQKGVPPIERARILGVRLHEGSYSDDN